MKVHLMFPDRDFDGEVEPSARAQEVTDDLELDVLFDAMAAGDEFIRGVSAAAILGSSIDGETIAFRQDVLADCLAHPSLIRETYEMVIASIDGERSASWWGFTGRFPSTILSGSVKIMEYYAGELVRLRDQARLLSRKVRSTGLKRLCTMLQNELDDDYLQSVRKHLEDLEFRHGVLVGARLGDGNKGTDYVVLKPNEDSRPWFERLFSRGPESFTYTVPERDDAGSRALSELRDRGINAVANALAQSVDHIRGFYRLLKSELAFYLGCLNLHDRLAGVGEPISLPTLSDSEDGPAFEELYDICLALTVERSVVGNSVDTTGRRLVVITGANHGGKSTFLRSVGVAQLMAQCGMFVGAASYRGRPFDSILTHFKRREDSEMESGKLDEELGRMSEIVDELSAKTILLFNEPFAATNEREGSEIARQVVRALVENGITVFIVTHLYDFARSVHDDPPADALFLRADREPDGGRTFRLAEGAPSETSYGRDIYREVFEDDGEMPDVRSGGPLRRTPAAQRGDSESKSPAAPMESLDPMRRTSSTAPRTAGFPSSSSKE